MSYNDLRRGRRSIDGQAYLLTAATHRRQPIFASFPEACAVARAIAQSEREEDWTVLAWVIMPDHVHLLVQLKLRSLELAMQRFKGRSSRSIGSLRHVVGPVWQPGFHDRALRREESVRDVVRYVCANPLRAGIASSLREYPFWNAVWIGGDERKASG
jgi:REP element-mobilizing transposase RayT